MRNVESTANKSPTHPFLRRYRFVSLAFGFSHLMLAQGASAEILDVKFDLASQPMGFETMLEIPPRNLSVRDAEGVVQVATAQPFADPPDQRSDQKERFTPIKKKTAWERAKPFEIAYQVLNVVDGIETQSCITLHRCVETNPLLGRHPSTGRLIAVKTATGVGHFFFAKWLSKEHPSLALPFEYISIGLQGTVVVLNLKHCF